ncbi:polysaccharide deacetylase family protein [Salinicoccus roseus]|uniref:hypothetical protein n=1 Tax=Salinicoccus roseus TaxID=45670 RepID=UPI001CA65A69|nr:hypothetical protein [Salinicoccus roseus]
MRADIREGVRRYVNDDIKASRFLKPQNGTPKVLRSLQLRRIKNEMTEAAKNNKYYHLWWHPHNFSVSPEENFRFLKSIIILELLLLNGFYYIIFDAISLFVAIKSLTTK